VQSVKKANSTDNLQLDTSTGASRLTARKMAEASITFLDWLQKAMVMLPIQTTRLTAKKSFTGHMQSCHPTKCKITKEKKK